MKKNYSSLKLTICALLAFAINANATAQNKINFNGQDYILDDKTILLDREDSYKSPFAVKTPNEAFQKISQSGEKMTLLVAPSVYWLDDPDDPAVRTDKGGTPYAVRLNCDSLRIIGLSNNPDDVVFAVDRGQTQGAVGNFTMFHFKGKSLQTENITFGNYCNIDLIYDRNPEFNRKKRKYAIVQAQIGICEGTDRFYADNCNFISRLNLCPFVGARRSLYNNCYFECTDDALSGSAVYKDCKFTFFSSKPFYSTAETGAVFLNCDITCLENGVQYFTKIPGQITAIDTRFTSEQPIEIKWTRDDSDIICRQINVTLNGEPYTIDSRGKESYLSGMIKDGYFVDYDGERIYNLPNLLNGDDGWDPMNMNKKIHSLELFTGKKLTGIPVTLRVHSDKQELNATGDTAWITATPLLWGGYPLKPIEPSQYISNNKSAVEKESVNRILTRDGLSGYITLKIKPFLKNAPRFKKNPQIKYNPLGNYYSVEYNLTDKGADASTILWARIMDYDGTRHAVLLKHGKGAEGKRYFAKGGDLGYDLVATVIPKYLDSHDGEMKVTQPVTVADLEQISELPESQLTTDFSDVPIIKREAGIPGAWSFDVFKPIDTNDVEWEASDNAGWYYGKGFDASVSEGIIQSEKGARMSYVPARDMCRNMKVDLTVEPAKSGGQGFGSATKQYMDICVKFNPLTLDGYALRIERTPDHDRAVRFSLFKYDKGNTEVINSGVISNCFRTPCHIAVEVRDGILSASASTDAQDTKKCCDEVVEKVNLSAPTSDNRLTGFCIQHTGSTGPSSTLIKNLSINWE